MRSSRTSHLVLILVKLLILVNFCTALYEDQIKKFDWNIKNIGQITDAQFERSATGSRILVSTKENVLAALCPRTGKFLWRRILEKGPRGTIRFFHFENDPSTTAIPRHTQPIDLITVTGHSPAIVRGWSPATGTVQWEWSVLPLQQEKAEFSKWFYDSSNLYHVMPTWGSHLEVTKYFAVTGHSSGVTAKISAPWIQDEKCILAAPYYACVEKNQLIALNLLEDTPQIGRKTLPSEPKSQPKLFRGRKGTLIVDDTIISLNDENFKCGKEKDASVLQTVLNGQTILVQSIRDSGDKSLHITAIDIETCEPVKNVQEHVQYPENNADAELLGVDCRKSHEDNKLTCNGLFSTDDGAIILTHRDKIRWTREESLSNIVAIELIDLPLSDAEGAIESELNSKPGDVIGALIRRISTQVLQIKNVFFAVIGLGLPPSATQKAGLIRDSFGLHKMIVAVTKNGKIFGMDNINGKIHWMKYLPTVDNFGNNENMKLLIQRSSKHFPYQPICALVTKDKITGNGNIYRFNPITGQPVDVGLTKLNYRIKQLALLRESEEDFLKGLLLLDADNGAHVIPESAKDSANDMYMFTADKSTAILNGFHIDTSLEKIQAKPIWKVNLGSQGNLHKILKIAPKNTIEHVHSQGRVLNDRSVLYKYINPNLVAVVTQALDNIHKYIMNIHLVDVVSGSVVFSMSHRKAKGPLHIVHSENWLVYSYYNEKVRRTEITTVELYEGKVQTNSTIWSSLDALPVPMIERQSYIIPAAVEAMRETITERGITNKHVLIGISSGGIVEMPWALLDPRRPMSSPSQAREEGSIPYIPELPLPTENFLNYNQTIARIENIYTAPSGLESTCLVIAYGIDIFITRVSPSKTFDLLKEDFDYFLITVVLIGLTTGSFVVKHLSARKALKQAWK